MPLYYSQIKANYERTGLININGVCSQTAPDASKAAMIGTTSKGHDTIFVGLVSLSLYATAPMSLTAYLSHPSFRLHEMGAGHPESPARLDAIHDRLLSLGLLDMLLPYEAPAATHEQLLRAHSGITSRPSRPTPRARDTGR